MLLASAGAYKVNAHEHRGEEGTRAGKAKIGTAQDDEEEKLVCVTSGVSFLGLALVNRLLSRGYSVRVIVDSEGKIIQPVPVWFPGKLLNCPPSF